MRLLGDALQQPYLACRRPRAASESIAVRDFSHPLQTAGLQHAGVPAEEEPTPPSISTIAHDVTGMLSIGVTTGDQHLIRMVRRSAIPQMPSCSNTQLNRLSHFCHPRARLSTRSFQPRLAPWQHRRPSPHPLHSPLITRCRRSSEGVLCP
jgi:hypothetical protein